MTIETKYKIGDKVWVEILGEPCLAKIGAINITTNGKIIWCSYDIRDRIDAAIKKFHDWGEKPLKTEIAREVANRIMEKVKIKIH